MGLASKFILSSNFMIGGGGVKTLVNLRIQQWFFSKCIMIGPRMGVILEGINKILTKAMLQFSCYYALMWTCVHLASWNPI